MGTIDGPISVPAPALEFDDLARLRNLSREIGTKVVESLCNYRVSESGGYLHVLPRDAATKRAAPGKYSGASTATVITFLVRSGRWSESVAKGASPVGVAQGLVDRIVVKRPWKSAGLKGDNAFTVAFLLELVGALRDVGATLTDEQLEICRMKLRTLVRLVQRGRGRISIRDEVPNSYLTDLATRVVRSWTRRWTAEGNPLIDRKLEEDIWKGAVASINTEMALLAADPSGADPFEIGYSVLLAVEFAGDWTRPEHRRLLGDALAAFFRMQHPDGSWPRSRRLFSYPEYGDAYCYEFEFLARLLRAFSVGDGNLNQNALLPHLPALQRSVTRLTREAVALPNGGYGWASGHHRHLVYPESWSTASVFDVCDLIDRLVTDTITTTILQYLEQTRPMSNASPDKADFEDILDSTICELDGTKSSLKQVLRDRLLDPILGQAASLREGKPLAEGTALSAILYGPPGTSKTSYASAIARYLGWDEVVVDPSHVLRSGFEAIHAEINTIFRMLNSAERVVAFFDEIDELVRDRAHSSAELSRFLTTSMLPRIVKLRNSKKLVFLVATNHIEDFDPAFTRPGRFDLVLPVMPPSATAKLDHWPQVRGALAKHGLDTNAKCLGQLEALTYHELLSIEQRIVDAPGEGDLRTVLADAARNSTLDRKGKDGYSLRDSLDSQADRIRTGR